MSSEQKPSAEDMDVALKMVPNATGILQVHLAEIIARVRREARAEAFEGAKAACREVREGFSTEVRVADEHGELFREEALESVDACLAALAAKERAS